MPKIVDLEQRKAEFVAASWDVIASEGLNAATLRRVAEQAGCTTGALTHYFPDRDALLIEALRAVHYAAGARMLAISKQASSDFERLNAVLLEALPLDETRLREWKVWIAFWGAAIGNDALAAENAKRYSEWRKLLEALIPPLIEGATNVAQEAKLVLALIDGMGLQLALLPSGANQLRAEQRRCRKQLDAYLHRFSGSAQ